MPSRSVGVYSQLSGSGLLRRPGTLAGWRVVGSHLRRFWSVIQAGQPIAEIDARLLRDVGLSEFAADKAITSLSSHGLADGLSVAGLGSCHGLLGSRGGTADRGQIRLVWSGGIDTP